MGLIIYFDGMYVPEEEAKVSVFDHGLLYGDGVFEGIRAYNGRVFRLKEHIDRFFDSAKAIALEVPHSKAEVMEIVTETFRRNNLASGYCRLIITRGVGDLGLDPRKCSRPCLINITTTISLYPEEVYHQGMDLITIPTRRNLPEAVNPRIKSLNYLNNILAKIECNLAGVQEAIFLNDQGYVAEATADNIFLVKNGVLKTPAAYCGALEGITRNALLELARGMGIPSEETIVTRYDLFVADECFVTGTAAELVPAVNIDGRVIGNGKPGPIFIRLREAFQKLTEHDGEPIYRLTGLDQTAQTHKGKE